MEEKLENLAKQANFRNRLFETQSLASLNYRQLSWDDSAENLSSISKEQTLHEATLKTKKLGNIDVRRENVTSNENLQDSYRNIKRFNIDIRFDEYDSDCTMDNVKLQNRLYNNFGNYQVTFNDANFIEFATKQFQKDIDRCDKNAEEKRLLKAQEREYPNYYLLQKIPVKYRKILLKLYPSYNINQKTFKKSNKIHPKIKADNEFKKYHLFYLNSRDINDNDIRMNKKSTRQTKFLENDKIEVDYAYGEIKTHIDNEINKYLKPTIPLYSKNISSTKYSSASNGSSAKSLPKSFFKKFFK